MCKSLRHLQESAQPVSGAASLRARVLKSGGWVALGYALGQALRFGSNLVLTRVLFPEAFGTMAIVQAVLQGATLISDLGVATSVVQTKEGDRRQFLNTAWTIQFLRGVALAVCLVLLGTPIARFYDSPALAELIPVAGISLLVVGLTSINLALADRKLALARVVFVEIGSQFVGALVTIALALVFKSVWALVAGQLVAALTRTIASHLFIPGERVSLAWDRDSATIILRFARWVLPSSLATFLAGEGSRLMVAGFLTLEALGFFALASAINSMLVQAIQQLAGRVLFAGYAEVVRQDTKRLYASVRRSRLVILLPSWVGFALLGVFGGPLIDLLYDARYAQTGAILQILAMGSLVGVIAQSYSGVLLAKGLLGTSAILQLGQFFLQVIGMALGYAWYGEIGVPIGMAAANWMLLPLVGAIFHRLDLWQYEIDLAVLALSVGVVLLTHGRILTSLAGAPSPS